MELLKNKDSSMGFLFFLQPTWKDCALQWRSVTCVVRFRRVCLRTVSSNTEVHYSRVHGIVYNKQAVKLVVNKQLLEYLK